MAREYGTAAWRFAGLSGDLKPRELMERAADPSYVPDAALMALIIRSGAPGIDVYELSRRLIAAFGSVKSIFSADWRALEARIADWNAKNPAQPIRGIGHVKCLELSAAFEIGRRWARMTPEEIRSFQVNGPDEAYEIFKTVFNPGDDKENLYALLLDTRLKPICEPVRISRGTSDSAPAFARDVYKEALRWGAHAVMAAHNHPSGDPTPSAGDLAFTRQLIELGKLAQVDFLDHLVIGAPDNGSGYVSIRSAGGFGNLLNGRDRRHESHGCDTVRKGQKRVTCGS